MSDTESFPHAKGKKETLKALLVELEDGREVWVPKSVIDDDSEVYEEGSEGKLVLASWFCKKGFRRRAGLTSRSSPSATAEAATRTRRGSPRPSCCSKELRMRVNIRTYGPISNLQAELDGKRAARTFRHNGGKDFRTVVAPPPRAIFVELWAEDILMVKIVAVSQEDHDVLQALYERRDAVKLKAAYEAVGQAVGAEPMFTQFTLGRA